MSKPLGAKNIEIDAGRLRVLTAQAMSNAGVGQFVPLTAPLFTAPWQGSAFSTTAKTLIDLSAVFGAPAGIKAILVRIAIRDAASAANDCRFYLSPDSTAYSGMGWTCPSIDDRWGRFGGVVIPCDANGDVYYQIVASGASAMDIYLEIWGYWILCYKPSISP